MYVVDLQNNTGADLNLDKILFPLTRHADTSEGPRVVKAGSVVPAGVALAFVDVGLTPGAREPHGAVAGEGAGCVDADAVVLAWRP